jgi:hypothetical protein
MPVLSKVAAFELEFNPNTLPLARVDLTLGLAVRIPRLHRLDVISEFASYHPEEEDNTLLVDRLMAKAAEVNGIAISGPISQLGVALFGRRYPTNRGFAYIEW